MAHGHHGGDVALSVPDAPLTGQGVDGDCANSVSREEFQNIRLVVDSVDGKTIEIALKGQLKIIRSYVSPSQATEQDTAATDSQLRGTKGAGAVDKIAYWDNMRGWLLTVATLFVGMAFQAAFQPPAWIPKHKDWFDRLLGKSAAGDITEKQAVAALLYLVFNTVTFSMALMVVVLLLVMRHKTSRKRQKLLTIIRGLGVCLAVSVSCTFTIGISDEGRVIALVCSIMAVYVMGVLFLWKKGYIRELDETSGADD